MKDVFLIGTRGLPAKYGGFETFVDNLVRQQTSTDIKYHVACATDEKTVPADFDYFGAHCFYIKYKNIGGARRIAYDLDALKYVVNYVKTHEVDKGFIVYILGCSVGPLLKSYVKKIHALGGYVFVNPDGLEWKRTKWPVPVRKYLKFSEREMVTNADLAVCDSKHIEKYIQEEYASYHVATTYIAYGASVSNDALNDTEAEALANWYKKFDVKPGEYYLVVGRFVPENNYQTIIQEFMASSTPKDLVIITTQNDGFYQELKELTGFDKDPRIKFVGTVYDQKLLSEIRRNAYGYIHGHSVGGTNPSLLEALCTTKLNLLVNVGFNSEVAQDGALYWSLDQGDLAGLIAEAEKLTEQQIDELSAKAQNEIATRFSWAFIAHEYEELFLHYPKGV